MTDEGSDPPGYSPHPYGGPYEAGAAARRTGM